MFLENIIRHKKKEIAALKKAKPLRFWIKEAGHLHKKRPCFYEALKRGPQICVIAEIKKKSPSRGTLRPNFDPEAVAEGYEKAGASALSVLTDRKFFSGSAKILSRVRAVTALPILRKDFILDETQVYESRAIGADAVLLIAAVLSPAKLKALMRLANSLGMDALVEVHTPDDARKALFVKAPLVGINNRDLRTFEVDLGVTERLAPKFPKSVLLVSESGLKTPRDLRRARRAGARAALVGETLMKAKDPGAALKKLLEKTGD